MAVNLHNTNDNTLLSGTSGEDSLFNGWTNWTDENQTEGYITGGGKHVTIKAGEGDDYIYNETWGDYALIYGNSGNDYIENAAESVTIDGGDGNDIIYSDWQMAHTNTYLNGSNGNDIISNNGSDDVTITGGSGDDSIRNYGNNLTISGGLGNDTVINITGENVNINLDSGNNVISLHSWAKYNVIQYNTDSGNDTIFGFDSNDILQIAGSYTTLKIVDDLIVRVGNGSITLKDVSSVNIVTVEGGNIDDGDDDTLPAGISVKNVIVTATKKFTGSKIDLADYSSATKVNAAAVTKNVSIVGSAKNNSLKGGSKNDTISGRKGNDTLTGGNGKDLFVYTAGNDVITDYVAGTDKISVKGSISSTTYSDNDVIFKIGSGTLTVKNGANKKITINGVTKKYSPPTTLTLTNSSTNKIDLTSSKYKNYLHVNGSKRTKSVEIVGNSKNNSIVGGSKNDTIFGGAGKDTLTGGKGADKFLHSAGNDFITDYANEDSIFLIDTEITGTKFYVDDLIWTTDNGSLTIKNGKNKKITYYDSESNPHVIDYQNVSYSNNFTVLTVKKNFAGDEIDLSDYADTVKKVNASAVTDNIEIVGNSKNNYLIGGKGSDILFGGSGNDTLKGGNGKDIFVHHTGDDVIKDYTAGEDKIQLDNTEITGTKVGDNDITFTTSTGTLTVLNGKGKTITIIDSEGIESKKTYSANITELDFIMADNFIADFENNQTEKISQENLITYAK